MFFHQRPRYSDQLYESAIQRALPHRPYLSSYRGWAIDAITLLREEPGDDRTYQVQLSAWDEFEERWALSWEVQVGPVEGELLALYWISH